MFTVKSWGYDGSYEFLFMYIIYVEYYLNIVTHDDACIRHRNADL